MGFYIPWLVDAARLAVAGTGRTVHVQSGWESRGHGPMRVVEGVVGHHTATPESSPGDFPSLNVITNGRSDLPGPLAHLGLGRSGDVYVIAAGAAYHAGASAYRGFVDLNDEFIGIEAEDSGDGVWTEGELFMYPRLVAACLQYMKRGVDRYCSHRTCATPAGRKIDPTGISDSWMQQQALTALEADMPLSQDDIRAIWYAMLEHPHVVDPNNPGHGVKTAAKDILWGNNEYLAALKTEVATLRTQVEDLTQRANMDADEVREASKEGATEALLTGTVKVTISGDTSLETPAR